MPFNWKEYLDLAKWLVNATPPGVSQEGLYRCAISRAYYAAFGHSMGYAKNYLGFDPRAEPTDHGRLRNHLRQNRRQKTSESLQRLREWRNGCDYHDPFPGDLASILHDAFEEADYVFRSLTPPSTRSS